ncbi:MAG: hypothetical protein SFU99_18890 [Saprospiraceae bacterium]|nr:hypothetical protein [Saprospiraceae bacterium]
MPFTKNVSSYAAYLYPNRASSGGDSARINLYCSDGFKLYLIFRDTTDLPANSFDENQRAGLAYEPIARYADYLDMVRNEKPITVTFSTDVNPIAYVVFAAS